MCWGLTYSRCIVGLIRQRGRLLLLLCAVKNIKPAELQQPEGVEPGGKVWMEKFSVLFFWQGGAVGEVWLISRKSKELPSLTNTNKNLHSWVKYIYGVCSSQNPDFRQSSFFFLLLNWQNQQKLLLTSRSRLCQIILVIASIREWSCDHMIVSPRFMGKKPCRI